MLAPEEPTVEQERTQLTDSLTSGVIALDAEGLVIHANQAARQYLGAEGRKLQPGVHLADLPTGAPLAEVFAEVSSNRGPVSRRELELNLADGTEREIGLSASLLQGPDDFNGVVLLFTDLTEQRRLQRAAELNRQLASLGELTAGIVHELRNPVSVISGMAELLLRRQETDGDLQKTAKAILRETKNLEQSISLFLGLARPYKIERAPYHPQSIAERAMQFCRSRTQDEHIHLDLICDDGLAELYVDAERMGQAVANLLVNAVEAVAGEGHVALHVFADGEGVVFRVTDDGPGVDLTKGTDLLGAFVTQKEGGTGLGLTIAHKTVSAHGGTMTYGNQESGGACFEIRIPEDPGSPWHR